MTEKEFRKMVSDLEITKEEKNNINQIVQDLTTIIQDKLPDYLEFEEVYKLGPLKYGTMLRNEKKLTIGLNIKVKNEWLSAQEKQTIIYNTFENILLLNMKAISLLRKESLYLEYQNYQIEIKIINQKETSVIEKLNNDYPLFKNTICILKQNLIEQKISTITDEILINLLGYSLIHFLIDYRYEGYIHAFINGIDEFLKGSYIDLNQKYYDEFQKEVSYENKGEYTIINFDNGENLTNGINQNILNDYRKLRKAIQKLTSVVDIITNNKEITIDVTPKYNQSTNSYNWSYKIENINLSVTGGTYSQMNEENRYDAISKALFKSLKVIVEKGFSKSTINVLTKGINLFDEENEVNNETKSKIKTIKKYIEDNHLKVNYK